MHSGAGDRAGLGGEPTTPTHLVGPDRPGAVRTEADDVSAALRELAGQIHAANAELVGLLSRFDALGGWHGIGIRSLGHWASIHLGIDVHTAAHQAQVGQRLAALPAIAAAAAAGELGWSKLQLVARVAEPASEAKWLGLAREMAVGQLARVVSAYRRASETDDPDRCRNHRDRRGIWLFDQPDGLVRITGLLEADDAAVLRAALAAQGALLWRKHDDATVTTDTGGTIDATTETHADDGTTNGDATTETHDDGTTNGDATTGADGGMTNGDDRAEPGDADEGQPADTGRGDEARPSEVDPTLAAADPAATRRVDALVALARAALAAGSRPDDGDDLTEVLLCVDLDVLTGHAEIGRSHLNAGPALPTPTARRLCCDALIRPLLHHHDQPLDLGRSQRLVNRAQRRALRFRDGPGCAFPGCSARHVDAHHITFWADGGPTDLDNLVLLCRHHHRLLHEGGYTAALVDNHPRFYRPDHTPIRPPDAPPPNPAPGSTELRRRHRQRGHAINHTTPGARSGGSPIWSPQTTLDALFS
ncbi:MAG TPA: DUF222 domain-containing protein [Acidimicrobiales bacterium]|nr:DUF222 domain-containing protein [Acidimicrobiales bacterium]